jgi:hypothetical protein
MMKIERPVALEEALEVVGGLHRLPVNLCAREIEHLPTGIRFSFADDDRLSPAQREDGLRLVYFSGRERESLIVAATEALCQQRRREHDAQQSLVRAFS